MHKTIQNLNNIKNSIKSKLLDLNHTIFFLDAHMRAAGLGSKAESYWPINDEIKVLTKNKGIIMVHDIFVPVWGELDKDDSNRLGYDTYIVDGKEQRFDYEYIKDALMDWSPTHRIEYNQGYKSDLNQQYLLESQGHNMF